MKLIFARTNILFIVKQFFKTCLINLVSLLVVFGLTISTVLANQTPQVVKISLGNTAGELKFFPEHLEFRAGQNYLLELDNPSPIKHYFTPKDFADASWTKKIPVGKVEVKGAIHELELKPEGEAQWFLTPMKAGTYKFYCSIAGHRESGMIGKIIVK